VERLVAEVDSAALDLHGSGVAQYKNLGDHVGKYVENLQKAVQLKKPSIGMPTGIPSLDNIISGLVPGEMTVIGARPSVGKTAISLQLMLNQAGQGIKPGMFSLEMDTNPSLMHRMVANKTGLDSIRIRTGHISGDQQRRVAEALNWLGTAGIFINDSPKLGIDQIIAEARRMVRREKVGVIYIDYVGLVRHPDKRMERHEQVADISARVKGMARELNVPVVLLSQLTRDTQGKKPTLANLRESGALEQDADAVYLLHKDADDGEFRVVNLDVAKNRNGSIGEAKLRFHPSTSRFMELEG
jgi:replicative DNA helicase